MDTLIRAMCRECRSLFMTGEPVPFPAYCPACVKHASKPVTRPVRRKKAKAGSTAVPDSPDPPAPEE